MHDLPFLKAKCDMTTFDEVLVKASSDFMDKAKKDGKPFFVWHNITRISSPVGSTRQKLVAGAQSGAQSTVTYHH
jgi:hypothetical protein